MIILGLLFMSALMRLTTIFLLTLLWIILNFQPVPAQVIIVPDSTVSQWKQFYIQSYGADYNLITGEKYLNLHPAAEGHPYFGEDQFCQGNLVINNLKYNNVALKYDVCNQKILLQYSHYSGSAETIILNERYISEFEIAGRLFRKYTFPEMETRFYQVLTQGRIFCLYYWEKDLVKGSSSQVFYRYLPEKKESYLVIDQEIYPFRSRGSFVKLFPEEVQKDIKHFLRSGDIWFGMVNEKQIKQLLSYCNELIQDNQP